MARPITPRKITGSASSKLIGTPRPRNTAAGPPRGRGPAWERPGARPAVGAPRPRNTAAGPPRGRGPAWERPGARPAIGAPRPRNTAAGPPRGRGPAWERPGARPARRMTQDVSSGPLRRGRDRRAALRHLGADLE